MSIMGNMVGGSAPLKTLIIQDENGAEMVGTVVGSEVIFTATDNDVREGSVYAGDSGVSTGTKVIPSYHTAEGYCIIPSGSVFQTNMLLEYDYTRLQVVICPVSGSIAESVAVDKVAINDGVYAVNSTELLATVIKDSENKKINLGIINESEQLYLMRYFTYKEIY